ncbi:MFS transporter [Mycetocola zhadangensis]|uniref:MFS transporter n=1 Tax=Mycetocola zhadangensis TaxID=1164595 RepID=A0A3L7ISZ7_9MICO|nr:MFS transporter [Mycetocola zhadangensis]RLQ81364.1 MFS transporter [Mycetocola zhadangensis]GGF02381.1 MFS transporter [Mycetocola zhadangensis]
MTTNARRPVLAGRVLAFVGIILVAANLRTAVGALSPIVGRISTDLALSPVIVGLLGSMPPVCFALFGILTPALVRRSRLEVVLIAALLAIFAGHLLRGLAADVLVLVLGSAITFAGLGLGNVLLPPVVKKYFPDRIALLTTIYVTMLSVSTLIPPLVAVPVADAASWRISLAMWAGLSVIALIPWLALLARDRRSPAAPTLEAANSDVVGTLWRSPLAISLAVVFGLSSLNAYAMFAWLPSLVRDTVGVSDTTAGVLLSIYAFMGIPAGLLIPILAVRMRNVALLIYVAIGCLVAGYAGLLLAPTSAPVLWVVLSGLGTLLFPLALVLINLRSRSHVGAIALSSFAQSVGYVIGAMGPLVVGLTHDATGGWTVPLIVLIGVAFVGVFAGAVVSRDRMIEDGA